MRHIYLYEDFSGISQHTKDFLGLEFELILHNRTVISGPSYSQEEVRELFNERKQISLIDSCYSGSSSYNLDNGEVKRAECAEKNIKEYIGNKLEELDCQIIYYRPMYIDRRLAYKPIKVYAPGASWDSGNEFRAEANFYDRYGEEAERELPKIIEQIKQWAAEHKVTHVLPHGPRILSWHDILKILKNPQKDVETFDSLYGKKEPIFTPIEEFKWEDYYW